MQLLGGFFESPARYRGVQRLEPIIDLGRQRRSHLAGTTGTSAGSGRPRIVEQQCPSLGRILDLGKPVAARDDAPNGQQQKTGRDRLAQESVKPGVAQALAFFGTAVGGKRDDARRQFAGCLIANALPGAQAVHVGHVQVHQHDIEVPFAAALDGVEAACRELQCPDGRRKRRLYEVAVDFVIVHRQHGKIACCHPVLVVHDAQYTPDVAEIQMLCCTGAGRDIGLHQASAALQLQIDAGPSRLGELSIERIKVGHGNVTHIQLHGMSHPALGALGDLAADCPRQSARPCAAGTLVWRGVGREALVFDFERAAGQMRLSGESDARVRFRWLGR